MKDKLKAAAMTRGLIEAGLKSLPVNYALYREYPDFYKEICSKNYSFICELNNLYTQQIKHLSQLTDLSRSDRDQIKALKESNELLTYQINLYEVEYDKANNNNNINVGNPKEIINYLTRFIEKNVDKISYTPYEKLKTVDNFNKFNQEFKLLPSQFFNERFNLLDPVNYQLTLAEKEMNNIALDKSLDVENKLKGLRKYCERIRYGDSSYSASNYDAHDELGFSQPKMKVLPIAPIPKAIGSYSGERYLSILTSPAKRHELLISFQTELSDYIDQKIEESLQKNPGKFDSAMNDINRIFKEKDKLILGDNYIRNYIVQSKEKFRDKFISALQYSIQQTLANNNSALEKASSILNMFNHLPDIFIDDNLKSQFINRSVLPLFDASFEAKDRIDDKFQQLKMLRLLNTDVINKLTIEKHINALHDGLQVEYINNIEEKLKINDDKLPVQSLAKNMKLLAKLRDEITTAGKIEFDPSSTLAQREKEFPLIFKHLRDRESQLINTISEQLKKELADTEHSRYWNIKAIHDVTTLLLNDIPPGLVAQCETARNSSRLSDKKILHTCEYIANKPTTNDFSLLQKIERFNVITTVKSNISSNPEYLNIIRKLLSSFPQEINKITQDEKLSPLQKLRNIELLRQSLKNISSPDQEQINILLHQAEQKITDNYVNVLTHQSRNIFTQFSLSKFLNKEQQLNQTHHEQLANSLRRDITSLNNTNDMAIHIAKWLSCANKSMENGDYATSFIIHKTLLDLESHQRYQLAKQLLSPQDKDNLNQKKTWFIKDSSVSSEYDYKGWIDIINKDTQKDIIPPIAPFELLRNTHTHYGKHWTDNDSYLPERVTIPLITYLQNAKASQSTQNTQPLTNSNLLKSRSHAEDRLDEQFISNLDSFISTVNHNMTIALNNFESTRKSNLNINDSLAIIRNDLNRYHWNLIKNVVKPKINLSDTAPSNLTHDEFISINKILLAESIKNSPLQRFYDTYIQNTNFQLSTSQLILQQNSLEILQKLVTQPANDFSFLFSTPPPNSITNEQFAKIKELAIQKYDELLKYKEFYKVIRSQSKDSTSQHLFIAQQDSWQIVIELWNSKKLLPSLEKMDPRSLTIDLLKRITDSLTEEANRVLPIAELCENIKKSTNNPISATHDLLNNEMWQIISQLKTENPSHKSTGEIPEQMPSNLTPQQLSAISSLISDYIQPKKDTQLLMTNGNYTMIRDQLQKLVISNDKADKVALTFVEINQLLREGVKNMLSKTEIDMPITSKQNRITIYFALIDERLSSLISEIEKTEQEKTYQGAKNELIDKLIAERQHYQQFGLSLHEHLNHLKNPSVPWHAKNSWQYNHREESVSHTPSPAPEREITLEVINDSKSRDEKGKQHAITDKTLPPQPQNTGQPTLRFKQHIAKKENEIYENSHRVIPRQAKGKEKGKEKYLVENGLLIIPVRAKEKGREKEKDPTENSQQIIHRLKH